MKKFNVLVIILLLISCKEGVEEKDLTSGEIETRTNNYFGITNIDGDYIKDTCELNGPVKTVIYEQEYNYRSSLSHKTAIIEYNQQRQMVQYTEPRSRGNLSYYRIFDESGFNCQTSYHIQDGDTVSFINFYYNQSGNWAQSKRYNRGERQHWNTINYYYNTKNQLIRYVVKTARGGIYPDSFRYDEKGRLVYYDNLSPTLKEYKYWKYDEKGYLAEEKYIDSNWATKTTHYMGNGPKPDSSIAEGFSEKANTEDSYLETFNYDESGLNMERTKSDLDGNIIYKITYAYNENGDPITEQFYSGKTDKTYFRTYEYEYDQYKNWVSKLTREEGKLDEKESQKITYYYSSVN